MQCLCDRTSKIWTHLISVKQHIDKSVCEIRGGIILVGYSSLVYFGGIKSLRLYIKSRFNFERSFKAFFYVICLEKQTGHCSRTRFKLRLLNFVLRPPHFDQLSPNTTNSKPKDSSPCLSTNTPPRIQASMMSKAGLRRSWRPSRGSSLKREIARGSAISTGTSPLRSKKLAPSSKQDTRILVLVFLISLRNRDK